MKKLLQGQSSSYFGLQVNVTGIGDQLPPQTVQLLTVDGQMSVVVATDLPDAHPLL